MTNEEFIKSISLEGEIWKDIVGYEGRYMVSTHGRVVSLSRKIYSPTSVRIPPCRILALRLNSGGYYQVALSLNDKSVQPHVHKLVAEAFIPNPNNYSQVDHIDCNKLNNSIENLRWCNQAMNNSNPITKARRRKIMHITRKKISEARSIPVVRLNPKDANDIKIYQSATFAAKSDGFSQSDIRKVCIKKRKQYRGYHWMYLSDYENLINMSKNS